MTDDLKTPEDFLVQDKTATLTQTEKVLSVLAVGLTLYMVALSFLVFTLRGSVDTLQKSVDSGQDVVLVNRENGYKNRAITCAIHENMVNKPPRLKVCIDPEVVKYQGTVND